MQSDQLRTLCILISGALFGFLPSLNANSTYSILYGTIVIAPLAIILVFLGTGLLQDVLRGDKTSARERSYPKIIGVLSDSGDPVEAKNASWAEIPIAGWITSIKEHIDKTRRPIIVKKITIEDSLEEISIVLNPYGGAYPETDLAHQVSYKKLIEYVRAGGIFVNVADIPMYWAFRKDIGDMVETPQYVFTSTPQGTLIAGRPFILSPLASELQIQFIGLPGVQVGTQFQANTVDIQVDRVTPVTPRISSKVKPFEFSKINVTPSFEIKFGKGKFMIWLYQLSGPNKQVARQLQDEICSQLVQSIPSEEYIMENATKISRKRLTNNLMITLFPLLVLLAFNLPQALDPGLQTTFVSWFAARQDRPLGAILSLVVFDGWLNLIGLAFASALIFISNMTLAPLKSVIRSVVFPIVLFYAAILANLFWLLTSSSVFSQSSGTSGVMYASFGFISGSIGLQLTELLSDHHLLISTKKNERTKRKLALMILGPALGTVWAIIFLLLAWTVPVVFFEIGTHQVNWVVHCLSFWISFAIAFSWGVVSVVSKLDKEVRYYFSRARKATQNGGMQTLQSSNALQPNGFAFPQNWVSLPKTNSDDLYLGRFPTFPKKF